MSGKVRYVGGVKFICREPGAWISEGETFAIHHVFAGVKDSDQWELYWMGIDCRGELNEMHHLVTYALTMGELCYDENLEEVAGVKDGNGPESYEDWLRDE